MTRKSNTTTGRRNLLARVHIASEELGMDEKTRRDFIAARFGGRRSCKELSNAELLRLVEMLESLGWRARGRKAPAVGGYYWERLAYWRNEFPQHREGMATPKQLAHIEARWENVSTRPGAEARAKALRRWLFNHFGIGELQWLDQTTASKVIEALKEMEHRRETAG